MTGVLTDISRRVRKAIPSPTERIGSSATGSGSAPGVSSRWCYLAGRNVVVKTDRLPA